ncbi:hypothetical protein ACWEPL_37380 [Nonomuraea sp. NPDC004186]
MSRLPPNAQRVGDLLPRPALGAGVRHVRRLQLLQQAPERGSRPLTG